MTDTHEIPGHHMQQKTSDKFNRIQRHFFRFILVLGPKHFGKRLNWKKIAPITDFELIFLIRQYPAGDQTMKMCPPRMAVRHSSMSLTTLLMIRTHRYQ